MGVLKEVLKEVLLKEVLKTSHGRKDTGRTTLEGQ